MASYRDFIDGLKPYGDKRIIATFGLGMASGFPLTFVASLLYAWLSEFDDIDTGEIGLFALLTTFYTWKFVWSPAIDKIPLGPISKWLGQRRSWLLVIQVAMTIAIFVVAQLNPATQLYEVAVVMAVIAFLSASQDIVIDAYRIELLEEGEEQGYSAASYVYGYRVANYLAGVGVLTLSHFYGWQFALIFLPLLFLPSILAMFWVGEPNKHDDGDFLSKERAKYDLPPFLVHLREAIYLPFKEFTRRPYWLLILLFIFLFKAGDAVTSIMTMPLLKRGMGFDNLDIAVANKTVGFITLMVGVGLGAILYKKLGVFKALFLSGVLMMATNLGFAWLASGAAESWRLGVAVGLENFATGLGTTVIIAYMANLCNANFTATQFALLSSLGNQARTILGAPSGYVEEAVGWIEFFIYATLMALPGLIVLVVLWKLNIGAEEKQKSGTEA